MPRKRPPCCPDKPGIAEEIVNLHAGDPIVFSFPGFFDDVQGKLQCVDPAAGTFTVKSFEGEDEFTGTICDITYLGSLDSDDGTLNVNLPFVIF